jgi:hypothetical protein
MPPRASNPPLITEADARRRLCEAYRMLLALAARRRAQTTAQDAEPTPISASNRHDDRSAPIH